jgi:peptidyl-prolyl cis-trans isomerase D
MIRFLQTKGGAQRILLALLIGLVSLSMVAFLGDFLLQNNPQNVEGVYATVGDQKVATQEVQQNAQREGQRMMGGRGAVPEFFLPTLYRRAAQNLVTQAALVDEAERLGLDVTEAELQNELRNGMFKQQLFPNGQYIGLEQYKNFVASFQMDVPTFERLLKNDLLIQKLINVIAGGVILAPKEIETAYNQQNVKVKFDYVVLQTSDLIKQVLVSEPELRAFYEKNRSRYENSIPELRRARYVVVDPAKLDVQITEDDYKRAYDQRQDQFRTTAEVDVRHILVATQEQALDIKKQLEAGTKFEDLANKYSTDPGNKPPGGEPQGGLYRNIPRGNFVSAFDSVAFSQPIGKVSDPVQTEYGWHLIRTDARRDAKLRPLAEVKKELEAAIRAEKQAQRADGLSNQLQADAKSEGLDTAASKHGLMVINADYFTQSASLPGIGTAPQAMQQIFAMPPKAQPEEVQLANGFAIVEVTDVKPAATPAFEKIRSRVEKEFRNERAQQMVAQKTAELADRSRAMNSLRSAAKSIGAQVKTSDLVSPSAQVPDVGPMSGPANVAFHMKPGQISGPLQSGSNGLVIALRDRQEPKPEDFEKQRDQIKTQLLETKRNEIMQVFALELRQRMIKDGKIRINDKEEKRLFGTSQTAGL